MAQYFTERLQKVFHMIFTSYNQEMAQEGLRQLELIVNNQHTPEQPNHRALRNDMTTSLENEIDIKEDALKIANDPEAREIADAYALLARIYAGPRFTWEESNFPENNMRTYQCLHDSIRRCSPIGTLQALRINETITPTVEKDMLISFDDAFRIVYDYAEQGDAFCQCSLSKAHTSRPLVYQVTNGYRHWRIVVSVRVGLKMIVTQGDQRSYFGCNQCPQKGCLHLN